MIFAALRHQPHPNSDNVHHPFQLPHPAPHTNDHVDDKSFGSERALQDAAIVPAPCDDGVYKKAPIASETSMDKVPKRPAGVTTTLCSPFPDVGEGRPPYSSDGESETESTENEELDKDSIKSSNRLYESPLLQRQVAQYTSSDPLETSPEPGNSRRSSILSDVQRLQHRAKEFPSDSQEGCDSVRQDYSAHVQQSLDALEMRERFTSASDTPESQQREHVVDPTVRHHSGETDVKQKSTGEGEVS